jgi:urate oxidase
MFFTVDRLTEAEGSDGLDRCGIDHKAVTVEGLKHLESTDVQDTLANIPAKILAVCPSLSRPVIPKALLPALVRSSQCIRPCAPH